MRRLLLALALVAAPAAASAQSSQFGARGLGLPGRPLSARAFATGGAFGLFDPESALNPASVGRQTAFTAGFIGLQDFRHVENPAGTESLRDIRFPLVTVTGPTRRYPLALGVSFSNYTARDFTLASADTVLVRDVLVPVSDTFASRGGLSDIRLAGAYRVHDAWILGAAFHVLTGSNRLRSHRIFSDPTYQAAAQSTEISYAGIGLEVAAIRNFGSRFSIAATARSDGHLNVDRDSTRVSTVDLPYSFGLGFRWRARPKLELASQALYRTWSGANSDLLAQGGTGSDNTVEVSFGGEYTPDPRRPGRRLIRFGGRYGTLPFPLVPGERPHEVGVSIGTGVRFAQERAGIDLGVERVWRSAGAGTYTERAFLITLGMTVRP